MKKVKAESRFGDAIKEEAAAKQQQIALQQSKVHVAAQIEQAKVQGALEYRKLKAMQKHEERMARLKYKLEKEKRKRQKSPSEHERAASPGEHRCMSVECIDADHVLRPLLYSSSRCRFHVCICSLPCHTASHPKHTSKRSGG
jgi:hypothetical protein